ncbi:MAG: LysR family transcriptional regulator [Polyangiaceae bacterium]|nr:LysR family transcriptional regulator [Polyangiaceae bacterium]MCW5790082.1 LysR family transcriptional regulator [Polyangiaceae bacterium]
MNIPWDDLRLFLAVVEAGSTLKAARQLRLSQPTVSRRIAQLEDQLGAALFERSVRGFTPTALGERLIDPAKRMAEWAREIEPLVTGDDLRPRGVVRITAPPGMAYSIIAPLAGELATKLPFVRLHVQSRVDYLDLIRREADLALRTRPPTQRDLVEVARVELEADAFATPEYIARLPRPHTLADIGFIAWAPPYDTLSPNRELTEMLPGFTPVFASDDFLIQIRAAEASVGAIFLAVSHLALPHAAHHRSALQRLHLDLGPHARSSLHLVAAKSALAVPRIRAVAEQVTRALERAASPPEAAHP